MVSLLYMLQPLTYLPYSVAGVSRSVTITAMYIMLVTSLSHEQALTIIRQCRPQAGPNIGFRTQLKNYYDKYAETVKCMHQPHMVYSVCV